MSNYVLTIDDGLDDDVREWLLGGARDDVVDEPSSDDSSFKLAYKMQVVFRNVNYFVQVHDGITGAEYRKQILYDLNGVFQPGRMTAIMGSSGAGKTSLMNFVAGHLHSTSGETQGEVLINGEPLDHDLMKQLSGYVIQDDVILDTMTVHEAISMSAVLRLPRDMPLAEKNRRVDEIIRIFYLNKCADNMIGSARIKGISGGERKRTSIAMDMISNPGILYLDEPTSGLDTFTAFAVMSILKSVAVSGRTIISTIHQPSSDIFYLFDDLILMNAGEIMYAGPIADVVGYFSALGYQCPGNHNPADFLFMSVLNQEKQDNTTFDIGSVPDPDQTIKEEEHDEEIERERLAGLNERWLESMEKQTVDTLVSKPTPGGVDKSQAIAAKATFGMQFNVLAKRAFKNMFRNSLMLQARLVQVVVMSLIFGLTYLGVDDDQSGIQDRQGLLFINLLFSCMSCTLGILPVFTVEKAVFIREYAAGMYSLPAYFLSRTAVEIPFRTILPTIGVAIWYNMAGLDSSAENIIIAMIIFIQIELIATAVGVWISAMSPNIGVGISMIPSIILPWMIFSGFFINLDSIPVFLTPVPWISPVKYAFVAIMKNEMEGLELHCSESEYLITADGSKFCPTTAGDDIIDSLQFDGQGSIFFNMCFLFGGWFVYLTLGYLALLKVVS